MSNGKHPGGRPRKELSGNITQEPANGVYCTVDETSERSNTMEIKPNAAVCGTLTEQPLISYTYK